MKILAKLDCFDCFDLLKKEKKVSSPLIEIKDKGGLRRPSNIVNFIIQECDKYLLFFMSKNDIFTQKNVMLRLIVAIQKILLEKKPGIMHHFDDHVENMTSIDCSHRLKIVKSVCELFLSLRLNHLAKEKKASLGVKKVRRIYTKLVLFNCD